MITPNEPNEPNDLWDPPPTHPPDPPNTRPPLDLPHLWLQVILIQMGIERRAALKNEKDNTK